VCVYVMSVCVVLASVCLCVCPCVFSRADLWNQTSKLNQSFCAYDRDSVLLRRHCDTLCRPTSGCANDVTLFHNGHIAAFRTIAAMSLQRREWATAG